MRVTPEQIVAGVRAHANANYDKGGWDEVVEAWDDADILKEAGTARTVNGAICKVAAVVKVLHSYAEDIRATAF